MRYRYVIALILAVSARADFTFELIAATPNGQESAESRLEQWFSVTSPTVVGLYGGSVAARPEYCYDVPGDLASNCRWSTASRASLYDSVGTELFANWYNRDIASWFEAQPGDGGGFGGGFKTLAPGTYRAVSATSYTLFPPSSGAVVGPMIGGSAKIGMLFRGDGFSNAYFATTPEPSAILLTAALLAAVCFVFRDKLRST